MTQPDDIDEQALPWVGLARMLWPEADTLFADQDAGRKVALGVGQLTELLGVISAYFALSGAGLEPTLRAVQQGLNRKNPNALPSPSDLVRFELRETFRPDDRAAQLDPPPSPEFRAAMLGHGYSSYWSDSYWAAHWDLPGLERGFEMLHRLRPGRVPQNLVFDVQDMRELLRKQDVLPLYHDRLMAVSYAPLTRVDVRRMFKLGVLSKDQVRDAYKDLGYDETNAAFLADFTEEDVRVEERELTRGDWIASFREGLATVDELREALRSMGYAAESAERVVALEVKRAERLVDRDRERLDRAVANLGRRVRRLSRAGRLDEELYRNELEDLGLSDIDIARFFMTYKVRELPKARDLSRADELAAFRHAVTTEEELRARLAETGLDAREVDRLVATEKAKMRKPDPRQKELSKTDVLRLYKKELLDAEETVERLLRLGYSEEDAEALVISNSP